MAGLAETVAAMARRPNWLDLDGMGGGEILDEIKEFGPNPGALRMRVHVPTDLAGGAALVVVLHGCSQTADAYAAGAGWIDLAERYGFAVVCPQQVRANNANLCFNWFEPGAVARGGGEVASIQSMIAHAIAAYALDPERVFITGLSAGGAMANAMLATYPETFAAGAIVAGLPYGAATNLQQALGAMRGGGPDRPAGFWGAQVQAASSYRGPWPRVSIWQGDADMVVQASVCDQLARQWSEVHGVSRPATDAQPQASGRRRTVWRDAEGDAVVELHRIASMGHGVPLGCSLEEGCGAPGPFLLEVGVSSSLEIARGWGLVVGPARVVADAVAPPPDSYSQDSYSQDPYGLDAAQRLTAEVGRTISEALRRAGLMG